MEKNEKKIFPYFHKNLFSVPTLVTSSPWASCPHPHTHRSTMWECMFLKPHLKYLKYEFKKEIKMERTTILSGLCHCHLNWEQTPVAQARIKRRQTVPKQLISVLCVCVCAAVCEPCQAKLPCEGPRIPWNFKEEFNSRRQTPHVISYYK